MLAELTRLAAALHQHAAPAPGFALWQRLWVAAHGPLGRRKAIDPADLARALQLPADTPPPDPYRVLFCVEAALVWLARETLAACGGAGDTSAASAVFAWPGAFGSAAARGATATLRARLATMSPEERLRFLAGDPFRPLYHALLPRTIRHGLGAYLSPPDLCAHVLDGVDADLLFDHPETRLIEPSCGLGAFFSALLARALERRGPAHLAPAFETQVHGVEKNLGSWLVARALLGAIAAQLGGDARAAMANVLWADAVFIDPHGLAMALGEGEVPGPRRLVPGLLQVSPSASGSRVVAEFDGADWRPAGRPFAEWAVTQDPLTAAVQQEANGQAEGLEAAGSFDWIVGNPPWVNWEHLDAAYKRLTLPCWPPLGLFAQVGRDRAFAKEDLSVLATSAACLRFGQSGTRVGLLLPQGLFQSRKNARGFRRFRLGACGPHLHVDRVDDFAAHADFGEARNRTAAFFCTLGERPTTYPVAYRRFVPAGRDAPLRQGRFDGLRALPSAPGDPLSNWALYGEAEAPSAPAGARTYRARTGVFTGGANAVFYVNVLGADAQGLHVENDTDRARVKVARQRLHLEPDWVFPFAKGRDVAPWSVARPAAQGLLLPHTRETRMRPVPPAALARTAPRTLAWFTAHEKLLATRASLTGMDAASVAEGFYSLLRVGDYTFAPYKVAWKYIARGFCCAVIGPAALGGVVRPTILQEKLIAIAFEDETEAHFVCAWLSTSAVRRDIERRIVGTQVSVHAIEDIHIPAYDPGDPVHRALAEVCRAGHAEGGLTPVRQAALDTLAARIGP